MKRTVQKTLAAILSVMLLLSCAATAWAETPERDANSGFTNGPATNATANSTVGYDASSAPNGMFYLIKDYDSVNDTKQSTNSTQGAPYSSSPAETFTYTITPYGVWNAGSTFSSGTATKIDTSNMPLLTGTSSPETGVTYSNGSGTSASRSLIVTQAIAIDKALKESSESNANDTKTAIYLPVYSTVGDYWYQVAETIGTTTGVFYGTNDAAASPDTTSSNGTHTAIYYLHVQVTQNGTTAGTPTLVSNVTLHKTAPTSSWTNAQYNDSANGEVAKYVANDKVNAIENRYYAGDLVIKKTVTGNAGDKSLYFPVTVVFTKADGTIVNSDIPFTAALLSGTTYTDTRVTIRGQYYAGTDANTIRWKQGTTDNNAAADYTGETTATAVFYVKDDSTVTFSNIPYGITYTVSETLPANDTYQNKLEFTNSGDPATDFDGIPLAADTGATTLNGNAKQATGSISDRSDEITITNEKTVTIDIGVITDNIPFIAMLAVAGVALILLIARKRKTSEV